jgi:hypothetical protein
MDFYPQIFSPKTLFSLAKRFLRNDKSTFVGRQVINDE